MAKRSVETAWKLLVDGYLPFVRERAGRINPDVPDPPEPNPIPAIAVGLVSLEPRFERTAALGVRSLQAPHPIDEHTAFPLASVSKPLASTTVALLMAESEAQGKGLAWSDKVQRLSRARELTYANLFSHRSGLPDHAGDLLEDLGFDRSTILDKLLALALNPIDRYAYTNFGLTAAAVSAAEVTGEAWEDLADRVLYRRLDMRSTSSRFEVFRKRENRTWGHRRGEDGRFFTGPQRNPDAQSPAGGVTASAHDLLAWMKLQLGDPEMLRNVGLVGRNSFKWIEQTHQRYVENESYGYGWNVHIEKGKVTMLSHSGGFDMGAGTSVALWPQDKVGIVALTNAEPTGAAEALCAGFRQLLDDDGLSVEQLQTLKGPSREHPDRQLTFLANVAGSMRAQMRPPRRDAGQPTPGTPFVFDGTYASDFYGKARFEFEGSTLIMYLGRRIADFDERYVLRPTSAPNVFVYDSHGEYGARNNRVEFLRGDGTQPDRVRLWNLFATYPQSLRAPGNGVCPLDGVIRAWSVVCTEPGTVSLAMMRPGDPTTYMYPAAKVVIGTNRFADADIEVRADDRIGFRTDRELNIHDKQPGDIVASLDFEIDREGTFTRVAPLSP